MYDEEAARLPQVDRPGAATEISASSYFMNGCFNGIADGSARYFQESRLRRAQFAVGPYAKVIIPAGP